MPCHSSGQGAIRQKINRRQCDGSGGGGDGVAAAAAVVMVVVFQMMPLVSSQCDDALRLGFVS